MATNAGSIHERNVHGHSVAPTSADQTGALGSYSPAGHAGLSAMNITDQLRETILSDLSDGKPLGSEDELVLRFGVSRPTLRQAIRILQAEGLVTVRRGLHGGMFVRIPSTDTVARSMSVLLRHRGATFADLTDVMIPLSVELMRLAAENPDVAARRAVAQRIHEYQLQTELTDDQQILHASGFVARRVDELVDNPVLSVLISALGDLVSNGLPDAPSGRGHVAEARAHHLEVADAIAEGDVERAQAAARQMRDQLRHWRT
jgi:GntR family transcriptional repressor for pyruvate dehydrogenase complex